MPFFIYHDKMTDAQPLNELDLEKAGVSESELRDMLAKNIQLLDDQSRLMVIAREYGSWEGTSRRVDVLAIEQTLGGGRLVVVELKRTKDGGHAKLQALRYAAMLSTLTFQDVVDALWHERRKTDQGASREQAQRDLLMFLDESEADEVKLDSMPRIMLIAQDFSAEITTTVMWLRDHTDLDISCHTVSLYPYGDGGKAVYFDLLLPLPQQADYLIKVRRKNIQEAQQQKEASQRQQRACTLLEAAGLLKVNDRLQLLAPLKPGMVLEETEKQAIYQGGGRILWVHDQKEYSSLSKLTSIIFSRHGFSVKSIQGTAYWGNDKGTLSEQAKAVDAT